MNYKICELLE